MCAQNIHNSQFSLLNAVGSQKNGLNETALLCTPPYTDE